MLHGQTGPIITLPSWKFFEIKPPLAKQSLSMAGKTAQYSWPDPAFGVWHLVTENDRDLTRHWKDKESALAELAEEGWTLVGPFPRRYRRRWVLDRTLTLIRFVQCGGLLDITWQTGAGKKEGPESAPLPPQGSAEENQLIRLLRGCSLKIVCDRYPWPSRRPIGMITKRSSMMRL